MIRIPEISDPDLSGYVYHRHSARDSTIYYRCSDKRCPAYLTFSCESNTFEAKNEHLDEELHKKLSSSRAMPVSEFLKFDGHPPRVPILMPIDFLSRDLPVKRKREPRPQNEQSQSEYIVRIMDENLNQLNLISEKANKHCSILRSLLGMAREFNTQIPKGAVKTPFLELACNGNSLAKVFQIINRVLGFHHKITVLKMNPRDSN